MKINKPPLLRIEWRRAAALLGLVVIMVATHCFAYWSGLQRRQFSDAQLINYGYHLGWNEGISMTEIPGAEIIDLSTGTKRVVPQKD